MAGRPHFEATNAARTQNNPSTTSPIPIPLSDLSQPSADNDDQDSTAARQALRTQATTGIPSMLGTVVASYHRPKDDTLREILFADGDIKFLPDSIVQRLQAFCSSNDKSMIPFAGSIWTNKGYSIKVTKTGTHRKWVTISTGEELRVGRFRYGSRNQLIVAKAQHGSVWEGGEPVLPLAEGNLGLWKIWRSQSVAKDIPESDILVATHSLPGQPPQTNETIPEGCCLIASVEDAGDCSSSSPSLGSIQPDQNNHGHHHNDAEIEDDTTTSDILENLQSSRLRNGLSWKTSQAGEDQGSPGVNTELQCTPSLPLSTSSRLGEDTSPHDSRSDSWYATSDRKRCYDTLSDDDSDAPTRPERAKRGKSNRSRCADRLVLPRQETPVPCKCIANNLIETGSYVRSSRSEAWGLASEAFEEFLDEPFQKPDEVPAHEQLKTDATASVATSIKHEADHVRQSHHGLPVRPPSVVAQPARRSCQLEIASRPIKSTFSIDRVNVLFLSSKSDVLRDRPFNRCYTVDLLFKQADGANIINDSIDKLTVRIGNTDVEMNVMRGLPEDLDFLRATVEAMEVSEISVMNGSKAIL